MWATTSLAVCVLRYRRGNPSRKFSSLLPGPRCDRVRLEAIWPGTMAPPPLLFNRNRSVAPPSDPAPVQRDIARGELVLACGQLHKTVRIHQARKISGIAHRGRGCEKLRARPARQPDRKQPREFRPEHDRLDRK